jgi:hypothetical protein
MKSLSKKEGPRLPKKNKKNKKNRKKLKKHIQEMLENFHFDPATRREIFSQIMELADHHDQQTTEKVISNDKTSESSESDA